MFQVPVIRQLVVRSGRECVVGTVIVGSRAAVACSVAVGLVVFGCVVIGLNVVGVVVVGCGVVRLIVVGSVVVGSASVGSAVAGMRCDIDTTATLACGAAVLALFLRNSSVLLGIRRQAPGTFFVFVCMRRYFGVNEKDLKHPSNNPPRNHPIRPPFFVEKIGG